MFGMFEQPTQPFLGGLERLFPQYMGCSAALHNVKGIKVGLKDYSMVYRVTILRSDLEQQNSYLCDDYLLIEGFLVLEKPNIATNSEEAIMEEHSINLSSIDEYTVSEVEK